MSAQRIDEVVLVNTEGSHRKAYRVWLEAEGALFHVGFAYGRIGAMLREGRKTTAPVARVTADALRAEAGLDGLSVRANRQGEKFSLRWILVHMIEEYARHNGHADLIRESLDGVTGE